jgi:hypothetical protein
MKSFTINQSNNHPTIALTKMVSNHLKEQSSSTLTIVVVHDIVSVVKYYETAIKKGWSAAT